MKDIDIVTITLNPAIDLTLQLEKLQVDCVNRVKEEKINPAGKGVNVSYYLSLLDYKSQALGFLGRDNSDIFQDFFRAYNIKSDFVLVEGKTRTNIKIIDKKSSQVTDVNTSGFLVSKSDKKGLESRIKNVKKKDTIFILGGSLPSSVADNYYVELLSQLTENRVILDTSGQGLHHVINSDFLPYGIKPNEYELAQAMDCDVREFKDESNILSAIKVLEKKGISLIVVSLGEKGLIYAHKGHRYRVRPVMQEVGSTVGAGDALVSGLGLGLSQNLSDEEIILLSTSLSMGAVTIMGIGLPTKEKLSTLKSQISITKL